MQLVFESRPEIMKLAGKLRWVQQRARISENPVLLPSNSADGSGASLYGSVLNDGGRYRMWYQGWQRDREGGDSSAVVCYAESDDGETWIKPELKLDDRFPDGSNVTDMGMHSPSVFIDPNSQPSHRYRAAGCCNLNYSGCRRDIEGKGMADLPGYGYYTLHSADGLHWDLDSKTPTWEGADVITSIYHPLHKCGIVARKQLVRGQGIIRRAISHALFKDGTYGDWHWSLVPDQLDDLAAMNRGFASADYYGMGMMPAGEATVGFIWQFRHCLPRTRSDSGNGCGKFGMVDIGLAYQHEPGSVWLRVHGQPDFINNRDVPWCDGDCSVYTASAPVRIGDEDRLYFCAAFPHAWHLDSDCTVIPGAKDRVMERGVAQIGYASWPRDRLFGYRAEPKGRLELNLGRHTQPFKLFLNVEPHNADGRATVAVKGNAHQTHKSCAPISDNSIEAEVQWENGAVIQPAPETETVVEIALDEATLWAWDTRPV